MTSLNELPTPRVPALAVRRGEARRFHFLGGLWIILADSATSTGELASLEAIYTRGTTLPPRTHSREDEFIYVLEGQLSVLLNREPERIAAEGAFVFIPRGTKRAIRVVSDAARYYNCLLPGGFEAMIVNRGSNTDALDAPPRLGPAPSVVLPWDEYGVTLEP